MKRVCGEIDVDADTPEDAARQALAIQRRSDLTTAVFDVSDEQGRVVRVALDENADTERLVCDNCAEKWDRLGLKRVVPNIPGLLDRIVPAGECPACGALVYPKCEPVRVLVLLDGGLVQDVLADNSSVEVAVLNQDIEGMFDEDIVEVVGQNDNLRGTLSAWEVTVAPVLVESVWRPVD